ncbi:TolC family protein [Rugamonas sp. FT107W]|uniref:TolC family protein n=1 Tax=Duganella vulcania TaxID=2692166 RepID=A0A845HGR8_9BURK|nr:TolC family protein [Duganella vulcania]MYN16785.1 TolC family protein [Duganella vulcania]
MRRSWICAGLLLSGCASYHPRPIDLERQADSFEQRTLASEQLRLCLSATPAFNLRAWPVARWDRPMLAAAAVCYSPTLEAARSRWESAKADAVGAGARVNPVLQFPFEYTTNQHDGASPYTTGPIFDIALETGNKRDHKLKQATLLAQAAAWTLANEEWKLRSQLRDALLGVYAGQQMVDSGLRQIALQRQLADMLLRRAAVGEAARPDVERAQLRLNQAQAELVLADQALLEARSRVAAIVGMPLAAIERVQFDLREFEQPGSPSLPGAARRPALLGRTDLRAALSEYEASQAGLQLEVARQYPDVHINAGYTYDAGANKISLGLASLTLPLLDRNQGPIAQAEARRGESAARVIALQDAIINEAALAQAGYLAARQAAQLASQALASATRRLHSQSAGFSVGVSDRFEFVQAQMDYQAVLTDHQRALIAVQRAIGVLENALQQTLPQNSGDLPPPEYAK